RPSGRVVVSLVIGFLSWGASARRPGLGVVEFGTEQAGAQLAEHVDVTARQEATTPTAVACSPQQPEVAQQVGGGERRLVGGADEGDLRADDVGDDAREVR